MESTAYQLGKSIAPVIIGILGYIIGSRCYKNKLKESKEENEIQ